jgi:ankyrin repeat protein
LFSFVEPGSSSGAEALQLYGTPLHYAIRARNEVAVRALLHAGADPYFAYEREVISDSSTLTPFRLALLRFLPDTLRLMIGLTSFSQTLDRYLAHRKSPFLHFALDRFADLRLSHYALCGPNYLGSLVKIIDVLRDIEGQEDVLSLHLTFGVPLLHASIIYGLPVKAIEHLLRTGCHEQMELPSDLHGHTPLQAAIYLNKRKTFLLLLKYGADIHRKLCVPLSFSYLQFISFLRGCDPYFAKELISRGAVPESMKDSAMRTSQFDLADQPPAFLAILAGNFELATLFVRVEGSTEIMPSELFGRMLAGISHLPLSQLRFVFEPPQGFTPVSLFCESKLRRNCFHVLARARASSDLETLVNFRYLLQQSRTQNQHDLLNQLDKFSWTPLLIAVSNGRLGLVREMLLAGADPNIGMMVCTTVAKQALDLLRDAPTQGMIPVDGVRLTKKESRWLEEDFKSIIGLTLEFGCVERSAVSTASTILSGLFSSGLQVRSPV